MTVSEGHWPTSVLTSKTPGEWKRHEAWHGLCMRSTKGVDEDGKREEHLFVHALQRNMNSNSTDFQHDILSGSWQFLWRLKL